MDLTDVYSAKEQCHTYAVPEFAAQVGALEKLINRHAGIDCAWAHEEGQRKLTEEHLSQIHRAVYQDPILQSELKSIVGPVIEASLQKTLGKNDGANYRVGVQLKSVWDDEVGREKRTGTYVNNVFRENEERDNNFGFPTRCHQDLDNNGNRSSHVVIYYFQLTPPGQGSNDLEIAKFDGRIGICECDDAFGYPNEIHEHTYSRFNWFNPDLSQGKVFVMNAMTIHKTGPVSRVPRLALNVKVHPSNMYYLKTLYGLDFDEIFTASDPMDRLRVLRELIQIGAEENGGLNFELGACSLLQGDLEGMKDAFRKLCLYEVDESTLLKMGVASIQRRHAGTVTYESYHKLKHPLEHVVEHSCGANLLRSIRFRR